MIEIFFGRIVERGKEYFEQGKVESLKKVNDTTYSSVVLGSEKYYVLNLKKKQINVRHS